MHTLLTLCFAAELHECKKTLQIIFPHKLFTWQRWSLGQSLWLKQVLLLEEEEEEEEDEASTESAKSMRQQAAAAIDRRVGLAEAFSRFFPRLRFCARGI